MIDPDFQAWLATLNSENASDLYVTVGAPPGAARR
jgi:Tfp pilus assembly ATPase PilU